MYAFSHIQPPCSSWAQRTFVSCEGEHIDKALVNVNFTHPCCLCCINKKYDIIFPCNSANLLDRLNRTDDVRGMRHDNQAGFGCDGILDIIWVNKAILRIPYLGYGNDISPFKTVEGAGYGVVFEIGRYGVVAGLKQTFNSHINGIGCIKGKNKPITILDTK